jgi:hypothetical protein
MEDWPLGLAGPEYWLYLKRLKEGEDNGPHPPEEGR